MSSWKRDTAICFGVVLLMYALVGLVFGLVFGTLFDCVADLTVKSVLFMLLVGLVAIGISCLAVSGKGSPGKDWIELDRSRNVGFFDRLDGICANAGMATPPVYVVPLSFPNAFAWGKSPENCFIAVTEGALRMLSEEEVLAVLGHEISHITHRDTLVKGVAGYCTKALTVSTMVIMILSVMLLGSVNAETGRRSGGGGAAGPAILILLAVAVFLMIFAGILALTIPGACLVTRFGVSRNREYLADAGSAEITGNPRALISALEKMENGCANGTARYNASETMSWIVEPNSLKNRGIMVSLLSTHPSTADRVARLEKIAEMMENGTYRYGPGNRSIERTGCSPHFRYYPSAYRTRCRSAHPIRIKRIGSSCRKASGTFSGSPGPRSGPDRRPSCTT